MKIIIAGGAGHLGRLLADTFGEQGDQTVILSRNGGDDGRVVAWDGRTLGA